MATTEGDMIEVNTTAAATAETTDMEVTENPAVITEENDDKENSSVAMDQMENSQVETVEGKRVRQLRAVCRKALEKTLSTCTYDQTNYLFSSLTEEQGELLQNAYVRIHEFLFQSMKEELDLIMDETNLREKLNQLDELIDSLPKVQQDEVPTQRRPMDPASLIRTHVMPVKLSYKAQLQEELRERSENNETIQQRVLEKRHRIKDLYAQVEQQSRHISRAAELCESVPTSQLQQTAMELASI